MTATTTFLFCGLFPYSRSAVFVFFGILKCSYSTAQPGSWSWE